MQRSWAAHEFLETNELLRKLTADIELHAFCSNATNDPELKNILQRHIKGMDQTYHQAIQLLQNKGANMRATAGYNQHSQHHPHVGMQNPTMIPAPNTQANRLSDFTMGTIILNSHKAGSMFGMLWANECVDPDVRSLHVMSANNCQQMAYEIWQFMNNRGYYEAPMMPANQVTMMNQTYQPLAATYTANNAMHTNHLI